MLESPTKLLFGDLLALARERWIREMARRLGDLGFDDYRRSDALTLRSLRKGELPLGGLNTTLGITRQGARKAVSGLVERGYARVTTSREDSRRRNVELTPQGRRYLRAVVQTLRALNDEVVEIVEPDELRAAYSVLGHIKDRFVHPVE